MRMLHLAPRNVWGLTLPLFATLLAAAERPAPPPQQERKPGLTFASQPGSLRRGNEVAALAMAPLGKTIAIARGSAEAASGQLVLWDRSPDKEGLVLPTDTPLLALAFSSDAKTLVAGGADGTVQVRDPATGKVRHQMHGHSGAVLAVLFTPDGKQLVSAGQDSVIAVWNPATGKRLRTLRGHLDAIGTLALRASGAAGSGDREGLSQSRTAAFQTKPAKATPSSCPLLLASGSRDQTVKLWDLRTGALLRSLHGHGSEVSRACFPLGNGQQLLTASLDGAVWLWDMDQGKPTQQSNSGLSPLHALACNVSCFERLALGSRAAGLRLLQIRPGLPQIRALGTDPEGVSALAFSSDDKWLVSGGVDGTVKLWDTSENLRLEATLPAGTATREAFPILAAAGSPDGKTLAVSGEDKVVDLLDAATGELRHRLKGHGDFVSGLAFSPDSRTLATASFDGAVRLWDVSEGRSRRTLTGHKGWVYAVAFSPDGKQLASGGYDRTVRLWDPATGTEVSCFRGHRGSVRCLAYSPDAKLLASGGTDRKVRLWDLVAGQARTILEGHEGMVRALAFNPDGHTLASASEDNTVRLWDVATGKEKGFYRHNDRMLSVAFGPSGDVLVSGSMDQTIAVLDPVRATLRATLRGHRDGVTALVLTPDHRRLISAGMDRTLAVWTAEAGDTRPRTVLQVPGGLHRFTALAPDLAGLATAADDTPLTLHRLQMEHARKAPRIPSQPVYGLTYSADGKTLAVCCVDGAVRLCDAHTGEVQRTLKGSIPHAWCAAFSPDGKSLAVASGNWQTRHRPGGVTLWDLATGKEKMTFRSHRAIVFSVSFSPDGKTLATASWDQTARLWDVATGKEKHSLEAGAPMRFAAFSPDGALVATAAWDGAVKLWDPTTGKEKASLPTPQPGVNYVAFSADGKTLAAAYNPYTGDNNDPLEATSEEHGGIQLWDVARHKELRRIEKMQGKVLALAFSPDGKQLASAGGAGPRFGEVRLWETASGKELGHLAGPTYWAEGVAFSPDGQAVAAGGGPFTGPSVVLVWNLDTELGRRKLKADKAAYVRAVYSPDGKLLAVGGEDGKVQLWDVAAGKRKKTLEGHTAAVLRLAFAADGKTLAAAGEDHTVCLWDVPTGATRQTCKLEDAGVLDVALSPDGKTLAVCTGTSADGTAGRVRLWDVSTGKEHADTGGMGKNPLCAVFAQDGKRLAVGMAEGVEVWDVVEGKRMARLPGVRGPRTLAFTSDGRQLAAAQDAGGSRASATIVVWELGTAREKTLLAGRSRLLEMHFSPDGSALTGVASDGSVQLWKLARESAGPGS